jgi:hypothetical protein
LPLTLKSPIPYPRYHSKRVLITDEAFALSCQWRTIRLTHSKDEQIQAKIAALLESQEPAA